MSRSLRNLVIAGRRIGPHTGCFVIGEAGVNHNGNLELAHRLIEVAAEARADAIKFQTFDPDLLASAEAPKAEYQARATGASESQREMLRRLVLSKDAHRELKRHAEQRGLIFLSTPFDEESADFLEELGVAAFKVASGEITNHPFIAHLAGKGMPVLLSTGMSNLEEVASAVAVVESTGAPAYALLHCTSSYPAPPQSANLRALLTLRQRFGVEVGYSDHTTGASVPLAAIALGATLLEKHVTLDRTMNGPDHATSMEPTSFAELVREIRAVEVALGDGVKAPQPCEQDARRVARRSLFAARELHAGNVLAMGDLIAQRPGTGISPARLPQLVGRRLKRDVVAGAMLAESDLE